MGNIYQGAVELIGKTPLVEFKNIEKKFNLDAKLVAKLEYFNPAGSVKDRAAYYMIKDAEEKGFLKEGYDGDLAIIDLNDESEIIEEDIITKAAWSPYINFKRGGRVIMTILRGNIIYKYDSNLREDIFYSGFGKEVSYY